MTRGKVSWFASRVRVEDALAASFTLLLIVFLGVRSALASVRLDEEKFWEFNFILAPVAVLVLGAAARYALGQGSGGVGRALLDIGRLLRDWIPFLLFLLTYEAFQSRIWGIVSAGDRDRELLAWDRRLFGETPAVTLAALARPFWTDLFTVAYFLHLLLPPVLALVWYRRDRGVFREFLLSILLAGAIGFVGYLLVPAAGPGTAFEQLFARHLDGTLYRPVTGLLDLARAPRDAFPSLHVAVSTIVLYFGGRLGRRWFAALLPLVVANWISTIYLRYHYLVDVIAGWIDAAAAIALALWMLSWEIRVRQRVSNGSGTEGIR